MESPDPEELRRMYWEEEMTLEQIGEEYGVSDSTMLNKFRELGIERRNRGKTRDVEGPYGDPDWLREKLREMTVEELAEEQGVSIATIYYHTQKHDMTPSHIYEG